MRITYDREADAAYIYLTDTPLLPGRDSIPCDKPDGVERAWVVMDWREGRIVGLEVLDASKLLLRLVKMSGPSVFTNFGPGPGRAIGVDG